MRVSSDYALSATLKARSSSKWDAPWVVVYANDPHELKQRIEGVVSQGVLDALVGADNALKVLSDGELNAGQPVQQQGGGAAWGTVTPQGFQPGSQHPQGQQQAPPQQQGGWQNQQQGPSPQQQGAQLHPEGLTCGCGQVLQYGKTRNNKGQWKCPDYRWNNGNPNDHRLEWAN